MLETIVGASSLLSASGPLFTLSSIDVSPITDTVKANAPLIIPAAIGVILIKKAVPLVPQMFAKLIRF